MMTCYTLTMQGFVECLMDKNYRSLLGKTEKQTADIWESIFNEFIALRRNKTKDIIFELQKDIAILAGNIKIINVCLNVLWETYHKTLADELKSMGFALVELDWSNKEKYYKELKLVNSKAKSFTMQMQRKEKELESFVVGGGGKTATKQDFIKANVNVYRSKIIAFPIVMSAISVAEWVEIINIYEEHIEMLETKADKGQE